MAEEHKMGMPRRKMGAEARRNSCEARPGLIESTHIAPLNEGLMAEDHMNTSPKTHTMPMMPQGQMGHMDDMKDGQGEHPREAVMESFMRHSLR